MVGSSYSLGTREKAKDENEWREQARSTQRHTHVATQRKIARLAVLFLNVGAGGQARNVFTWNAVQSLRRNVL